MAGSEEARLSEELAQVRLGLGALMNLIDEHDDAIWQVGEPPFAKLRHIHMHLSKCSGKLAGVVEPLDHEADARGEDDLSLDAWRDTLSDLAADLVIHAAQLARLGQCQLDEALMKRWRHNTERFGPDTEFARLVADE